MKALNAIAADIAVWLVYIAVRKHSAREGVAIASALLFASSATWWKFATDADPDISGDLPVARRVGALAE